MPSRPNILLIHTDQHRADCLGAYGNRQIRTPHIDALAADGVRFDNCFCPYPLCTPSRYSLLSGLYAFQHRGLTNRSTLAPHVATFPRVLRDAGYRTTAVGKMHFTPTYLDVGFERMVLAEQDGPGRWDDDYHRYLRDRDLVDRTDLEDQRAEYRRHARPQYWQSFGALPNDLPEEHDITTWTAQRAMEELDGWGEGNHLLMVGFVRPHHPFNPPGPWCDLYDPTSLTPLPGWTQTPLPRDLACSPGYFPHADLNLNALQRAMAGYYGAISQIDHHVGRMLELLRRRGLYDRTLVVLLSDHGEYLGFHHLLLKGGYMYDPLARVPLIVKPAGRAPARASQTGLCSLVDVAPTLLRQAGCAVPAGMTGPDLLAETFAGREIVFAECGEHDQRMARTRTHKLVLVANGPQSMLLDLMADPLEQVNRIDDPACRPELRRLEQALRLWRPNGAPQCHCDELAPTVAPPRSDGDSPQALTAYYHRAMTALGATPADA